jgi:hypothetical protein
MGYDIALTARAIAPIKAVLDTVRRIPRFTVIYTREGHRPDLTDLPENKLWRRRRWAQESAIWVPAAASSCGVNRDGKLWLS